MDADRRATPWWDVSRLLLKGVGLEPNGTIPHLLYMC
jgi:hypothetical protein